MLPPESAATLRQFLILRGVDFDSADLGRVIGAVLEFYETVSASGVVSDVQSDMLLFQYGVYDWGDGECFEVDLTRQFIIEGEEGDDAISQLRCTTFYSATSDLKALGCSDFWCSARHELDGFAARIFSCPALRAALPLMPIRREIRWEQV